jgi:peptidoglycan/xylan/chitin deacetylase (PgdA/CDA1 family)
VHGRERRGVVAFTFDDGPHRDTTPRILAALAAHEVPAAFFVCGYQLDGDTDFRRANAALLDAEIAAGYLVGNHTYRHSHLGTASMGLAWSAISGNERMIASHLGGPSRLFRPPYGRLSRVAERLLGDLGYTIVRWSIESDDYRPREADELRDDVLRQIFAEDGGIVLMHDTKAWTAQALPQILSGLDRENCRRIARGTEPILPVSLDYFATDASGQPLPIPPEVEAQTARTRAALERRCADRRARSERQRTGRGD